MIHFDKAQVAVPDAAGELRTIVQELSLTLSEKRIALIGANGSGKSTIAKMINGLVLPTSGSVTVHTSSGAFDTKRNGKKVRDKVAFVFTDPKAGIVMPTVIEDVTLSLRSKIKNNALRTEHAIEVLKLYGLDELRNQSVHTLSGGQSQLLAIAAVLAVEPEILVADEPTTLLDLQNTKKITSLLFALPQQVIVATHDLKLALACDRTLWIKNGKIKKDGDPTEVVAAYKASV